MSELLLFDIEEITEYIRPQLPEIYTYENLPINKKINYKSCPMFLYGDQTYSTIATVYNKQNYVYGLNRTGLDYSLAPTKDYRK